MSKDKNFKVNEEDVRDLDAVVEISDEELQYTTGGGRSTYPIAPPVGSGDECHDLV
ncbi:MAG: hypothetical protein AAFX44_07560 [Pseudomonadota bacterium]